MRILFITPSYKPAYIYGGPVVVISLLAESLVQLGHEVTVYTTTANGTTELPVLPNKSTKVNGVEVYYFKRITGDHTHISIALWRKLKATVTQFDIVHLHSWWNILIIRAAWICRKKKIQTVLSPHGMFSNYILNTNNAVYKKWIHRHFGRKLLAYMRLHVSTKMEWDESQMMVRHWSGAIIPNPVLLPSTYYEKIKNDIFTIGFLSRIDPKKGLDILIQALSKVDFAYRLLVAGNGETKYVESLQAISKNLGNHEFIEWLGWKNNDEKFDFLAGLDLFSLISHSENFAIVVVESLAVGTPVLVSKNIGLASYIDQHQLGWLTSTTIDNVVSELQQAYHDTVRRRQIQLISPELIKQDFDSVYLAQQYADLYMQDFH